MGSVLLRGEAKKNDDGYLPTAREPFAADSHALATDNLDIDLDGAGRIVDHDEFGNARIEVQPRAGKPIFVGIAPHRRRLRIPERNAAHLDHRPVVRTVSRRVSRSRRRPPARASGWVSIGAGVILLTVAGALLVRVTRRPCNRSTVAEQPAVPAAA